MRRRKGGKIKKNKTPPGHLSVEMKDDGRTKASGTRGASSFFFQPRLEETQRGMADKGRRRHLKSLGAKCKSSSRPKENKRPGLQALIDGAGVIMGDYCRYAANYTSLFVFFSLVQQRERKKKTVNNSFEQVAQSKHFWVDVDLERNAGHFFPFGGFFFHWNFFIALYELLTRLNQRHQCAAAPLAACVRAREEATCWRAPRSRHSSDGSSENPEEPQSPGRKERKERLSCRLEWF